MKVNSINSNYNNYNLNKTNFKGTLNTTAPVVADFLSKKAKAEIEAITSKIKPEDLQAVFNEKLGILKSIKETIEKQWSPMAHFRLAKGDRCFSLDFMNRSLSKHYGRGQSSFDTRKYGQISESFGLKLDSFTEKERRENMELKLLDNKITMLDVYKDSLIELTRTQMCDELRVFANNDSEKIAQNVTAEKIKAEYAELVATNEFYQNNPELLTPKILDKLNEVTKLYEPEIEKIIIAENKKANQDLEIDTSAVASLF